MAAFVLKMYSKLSQKKHLLNTQIPTQISHNHSQNEAQPRIDKVNNIKQNKYFIIVSITT